MAIEEKAKVAIDSLSDADACDIFKLFGYEPASAERIYGGYASSNFKVVGRRGGEGEPIDLLMKINHYVISEEDLMYQVTVLEHLRPTGFPTNYPHAAPDGRKLIESAGRRTLLLDFIAGGVPGDKVLGRGEELAGPILRELSGALANLHSVRWPEEPKLRDIRKGYPVCNTGDLLRGDEVAKLAADARFAGHPIVTFATESLTWLRELYERDVPWSVIHGDGFLDNTLFSDDGGEPRLLALIDWEDSCVAPLALDVAIAASACCFTADNELLRERLSIMLKEYNSQRPMSALEKDSLIDFMIAGAFACGFYRFCEFNVRQPESDEKATASFQIMLDRANLLKSGAARSVVQAVLAEL